MASSSSPPTHRRDREREFDRSRGGEESGRNGSRRRRSRSHSRDDRDRDRDRERRRDDNGDRDDRRDADRKEKRRSRRGRSRSPSHSSRSRSRSRDGGRKEKEPSKEGAGSETKNGNDGDVSSDDNVRGHRRRKRTSSERRHGRRSDGRSSRGHRSDKRRDDRSRSRKRRKQRRSRSYSSSSSASSSSSSDSSSSSATSSSSSSSPSSDARRRRKRSKHRSKKTSKSSSAAANPATAQPNRKLLAKLTSRNETLEEREERRAKRRAARITARFGYTPEDNPFRDPNLHEVFTWKKKEEKAKLTGSNGDADQHAGDAAHTVKGRRNLQEQTFAEIEKVRQRREQRELHLQEMERLRAEEAKMKELENYDEWARKEEEFHLQQQRQRSAIRLVEGREKPVDVLAQNMLLFGLSTEEKEDRARVKYKEKYSALEELETLEANLQEPCDLLGNLKLGELEELLVDVDAFRRLEREAMGAVTGDGDEGNGSNAATNQSANNNDTNEANPVIRYWDALHTVILDEIQYLKTGGQGGTHASLAKDIREMFQGQSMEDLLQMKEDIQNKLGGNGPRFDENGVIDTEYWQTVLDQLHVHLAKVELSDIHSKMLVRQLEKLESKREELRKKALSGEAVNGNENNNGNNNDGEDRASYISNNPAAEAQPLPYGIEPDFGNLEEELGLNDEIDLHGLDNNGIPLTSYAWQDKYRPRKPRYFNRVKTGYDWNAYNKTHYDHDNPPPKIVQGYKFNIFYPDLIDKTKTPQYFLERADTDDFCILRFKAGPPYEDVAFKIINRQWNKSRKRGFRCTFERGVLSLYFNFASHWYRR